MILPPFVITLGLLNKPLFSCPFFLLKKTDLLGSFFFSLTFGFAFDDTPFVIRFLLYPTHHIFNKYFRGREKGRCDSPLSLPRTPTLYP